MKSKMGECKQVNTFSKAILLRKVFKILKSGKKWLPFSFLISDIISFSYTRHDSISKCYQSLPTVAVSVCIPPPHEICNQQSWIFFCHFYLFGGCLGGWINVWVGGWMVGWIGGLMSDYMYVWVGGWIDGWMDGWVDGSVDVWMYWCVVRWMNECMDGLLVGGLLVGGWMNGWVGGWMNAKYLFSIFISWTIIPW